MLLSQLRDETSSSIFFFQKKNDLRICWLPRSYGVVAMLCDHVKRSFNLKIADLHVLYGVVAMLWSNEIRLRSWVEIFIKSPARV